MPTQTTTRLICDWCTKEVGPVSGNVVAYRVINKRKGNKRIKLFLCSTCDADDKERLEPK
jgi:hypothetical protein